MDLRSGETVWRVADHEFPEAFPPLRADVRCDVAIIGGGITGALTGYELTKAGFDCVLIDRRNVGGGSTAASTALILYELDTHLCDLAARIGEADAVGAYQACVDAVAQLAEVVRELGGGCDHVPRKSFYFAEDESEIADLAKEQRLRSAHGLDVEFLERRDVENLFSFSRPAALVSTAAAELDVVKLVSRLVHASIAKGMRVFGETELKRWDRESDRVRLVTDANFRINAREIVFATGYESERILGRKVGDLQSTFAIATKPMEEFPGWHERSLLWTTARPYLYLRTTADGRAVIGGEDEPWEDEAFRDALLPRKTAQLAAHLQRLFPGMPFTLDCAWAGTFGETPDSLARIGQPDGHHGAYFALGFGGNGITFSMIAAQIIRDACRGRRGELARLFRFDR